MVRKLKVLIADDHAVVRHGIREIIERHSGWDICGEASNGQEVVLLSVKLTPDVVVLDLAMPELNGLEATRQIRMRLPCTEILIFSMLDMKETVREALAAGARGYVVKSDALMHLERAIEALARHEPYFTATASTALLDTLTHPGETSTENAAVATDAITTREREVLQLLVTGATNKEVATTLSISIKTVETHRAAIMHKLGLTSMAGLVRYAVRANLITA